MRTTAIAFPVNWGRFGASGLTPPNLARRTAPQTRAATRPKTFQTAPVRYRVTVFVTGSLWLALMVCRARVLPRNQTYPAPNRTTCR